MYCQKCGTQVPDGSFCPNCGSPLTAGQQPPAQGGYTPQAQDFQPQYRQSYPGYAPNYQQPYPGYQLPQQPDNRQTVLDTVRELAGSTVFLIAVIGCTLGFLFSLLSSLMPNAYLGQSLNSLYELLRELGMDSSDINQILNGISVSGSGTAFSGLVPNGLILGSLWSIFAAAKNRNQPMGTGGLTTLKVLSIIELVLICILAAVACIVMIAGVSLSEEPEMSVVFLALLIALAAVFALVIVMIAMQIKTINTAKKTILTGVASTRVSGFLAVMLFIGALGSLSTVAMMLRFGAVFSGLGTLCNLVAYVCFGVLIFQYRSRMKALTAPGR